MLPESRRVAPLVFKLVLNADEGLMSIRHRLGLGHRERKFLF
jgi:hypothetical protein